MDDVPAWLAVARAPGLHAGQLAEWLALGHAPADLTRESPRALAALGLGSATVDALLRPDAAALARDRAWLAAPGHALVPWRSPDYP
ncbi:MAG TPA: hypothetical protein VF277_05250, partial [Steroidobacteraceae bacterium]